MNTINVHREDREESPYRGGDTIDCMKRLISTAQNNNHPAKAQILEDVLGLLGEDTVGDIPRTQITINPHLSEEQVTALWLACDSSNGVQIANYVIGIATLERMQRAPTHDSVGEDPAVRSFVKNMGTKSPTP